MRCPNLGHNVGSILHSENLPITLTVNWTLSRVSVRSISSFAKVYINEGSFVIVGNFNWSRTLPLIKLFWLPESKITLTRIPVVCSWIQRKLVRFEVEQSLVRLRSNWLSDCLSSLAKFQGRPFVVVVRIRIDWRGVFFRTFVRNTLFGNMVYLKTSKAATLLHYFLFLCDCVGNNFTFGCRVQLFTKGTFNSSSILCG